MPNLTRDLAGACLRRDLSGVELGEILEVGCGTGRNTQWLVKYGRVVGLDFSQEMISRCRIAAPESDLHITDLTTPWPIDDGTVDTVVIDLVLEHIKDLDHIAEECARVLRGGGRLRISELHPLRQQTGKGARFEDAGALVELPVYMHTIQEYVTAFRNAGFELDALSEHRALTDSSSRSPRLLVMVFTQSSP